MKKIIALMLALVMCFALVACGGSNDSADDAGFKTAVEGKLYVATNVAFPPYEFYEGTEAVGIDMDIARAIGEKLGLPRKKVRRELLGVTKQVWEQEGYPGDISINKDTQLLLPVTQNLVVGLCVCVCACMW